MNFTLVALVILAGVLLILFVCAINVGRKYNKTDWQHRGLNILDGLNAWLCQKYHRLPKDFIELPDSGPALIVCNHISGLDPLLLIAATKRPLRFMIAQEEYDRWWLKWLLKGVGCIPVKREKNPTKAFNECLTALENDQIVVVFPQGGIVTEFNGKPLKKGAFVLAKLAQVPLICFRLDGVKGEGFTLIALFMRSNAQVSKNVNTYEVTDESIGDVMNDVKRYIQ